MSRLTSVSPFLAAVALLLLCALPAPLAAATKKELADAAVFRGYKEADAGRLDAAIAEYSEAIRIEPKLAYPYFVRGEAKLERGDAAGAIADLSEGIRLDPRVPGWFESRARAKIEMGDYPGAVDDFSQALRLEEGTTQSSIYLTCLI